MLAVRRSRRAPDGFTLVELLVTISIIGIAFVALFTGLSTFFAVSAAQRANASNDTVVRQYVEQVTARQTPYAACGSTYSNVTLPAGFAFSAGPTITYWEGISNPQTFAPAAQCATYNSNGVQKISVTIRQTISQGRTHDTVLTFTKRNPS